MKKEFSKFVIHENASILGAMKAINENHSEVVFVMSETETIEGVITDGDIRRGLLAGLDFSASVQKIMSKKFVFVGRDVGRAEALDLMKARGVKHLPIVGSDRRMLGVHLLTELIGSRKKPNLAVIMAGGRGTRLGSLTDKLPKPMISVAGRPILERLVLQLIGSGVSTIYISVNYMADVIRNHFGNGEEFGCRIHYLEDSPDRPLGTGGALSLLPKDLKEPVIVLNGDLVVKFDLDQMLEFHREGPYVATVCSRAHVIEVPFGVLGEVKGRLQTIEEKPAISLKVNAGIYLLEPSVLKSLVPNEAITMPAILANLLQKSEAGGTKVGVFEIEDEWTDVGRKEDLRKAKGLS
jgi:dTDP-glucose pyrophosphorylase